MRVRFLRSFAFLTFAVAVALLHAQGDPAQPGTNRLSVTSRLVVLDVVVLDRDNKPVLNLDQSKFSVYEDKVQQKIRYFDPPSGHEMPAVAGPVVNSVADLPKIGLAPVNVLVLDEVDTPFHDLAYARQQMEKYLKAQPEVLPVPTLFVAAGYRRMAVLHDYTQSRAELLLSVQKHTADLDFTQIMATLNGGASASDSGMVKTLGALSQIAASLKGVPGRKNVIWVGPGYNKADDLTHMSESDRDRVTAMIQTVVDRMLSSRIVLYSVDPAGVVHTDAGNEQQIDPTEATTPAGSIGDFGDDLGFNVFVKSTGGRAVGGRNDLGLQVAQLSDEGTKYYTLAYTPTSANDAARPYRKIRVVVNDPALHVITRDGYFGGDAPVSAVALAKNAKQPRDIRFDLLNAARTTMAYTGLHMEAQPTKNGYTLLVNANDLRFNEQPDGSRLAEVTLVAVCYDRKGKETAQHAAELKEELAATDKIVPNSKVGFGFPMVVPAFTGRVRFVMRDASTGTLGSADHKP